MTMADIQTWIDQNPVLAPWVVGAVTIVLSVVVFLIARLIVARGLVYLSKRTESKYDDIVVEELRPFRFAWIAPLLLIYFFAGLLPQGAELIRNIMLFLILWLGVFTVNSLLNAVNAIYEASDLYRGDSIQVYIDLGKIVMILVGIILSISMFTGQSPLGLLTGLGAMMAVLLLIFRDTILSFVAGMQIQSNDLVNEGDWLEVPSYSADGDVLNISLHSVKVQNFDKTISVIPTYKLVEVPFKNWRGMQEAGGRRIKRAIHLDVTSIKFCDREMIERLGRIDLVKGYIATKLAAFEEGHGVGSAGPESSVDARQFTNLDAFRAYVTNYLKSRPDLYHEGMTLLVRQLAPGPSGMPLEVYVFTKTVNWIEYEDIQADIFSHIVAVVPQFDLHIFQEPAGADFRAMAGSQVAVPSELGVT
ncbi:mechanosensitive ion channel family protein [Chloroflexota bacterium]